MSDTPDNGLEAKEARLAVGVVIRKQPGVTRWAKWVLTSVG